MSGLDFLFGTLKSFQAIEPGLSSVGRMNKVVLGFGCIGFPRVVGGTKLF